MCTAIKLRMQTSTGGGVLSPSGRDETHKKDFHTYIYIYIHSVGRNHAEKIVYRQSEGTLNRLIKRTLLSH